MHTNVTILRRALNTVLLASSMLLLCQPWAQAQSYPNKPVRLIVPWPAGGLVDGAARQLGTRLQNSLGHRKDERRPPGLRRWGATLICPYYGLVVPN